MGERNMNTLRSAAFVLAIVLGLAGTFLWAIWVAPFVRDHGRRNAFFLNNWASRLDYRTAVRIAEETGRTPWFVKAYGTAGIASLVFVVLFIVLCVMS